jgi:hypothetical protein
MMAAKKKAQILPTAIHQDESQSIRVEKIKNGFLAHHTHAGKDGSYSHEVVYHPTAPKITVGVVVPAKKRGK